MNTSASDSGREAPVRIAMWSGPRNISTAMMRSWENRPDTFVTDEPLYAHYLLHADVTHPGAEEVIASQENDWERVVEWLTGPVPEGRSIWYQKHMTHHLLPSIRRDWLASLRNCFLIRNPREMLISLAEHLPSPRLVDTGLPQQVEVFQAEAERLGSPPPVLDARDVQEDPRRSLSLLCGAVGVPFSEQMLLWPPGTRPTDGVWARHWYASVEESTGFQPHRPRLETLSSDMDDLYLECMDCYSVLYRQRLR